MTEPFASSDPPHPDLPPDLLVGHRTETLAGELAMPSPPDAAAPSLPAALLTMTAAGSQVIEGAMPPESRPDLEGAMLAPDLAPSEPVGHIPAPDLASRLLDPAAPEPAGSELGAASAGYPPDSAVPLSVDAAPPAGDLSFEQKWDDLARRLGAGGAEPSDAGFAYPPDLPAELLLPERDFGDGDDTVEA